jgi:hypothetical protein
MNHLENKFGESMVTLSRKLVAASASEELYNLRSLPARDPPCAE